MNRKRPEDLRSHRWLGVNDLRSFGHRSRLRQFGYDAADWAGRPVIGIINTWSEINACHAHLRARAEDVKRGVLQAGGFPIELPAMSLAEPFVKPSTMLYRNFLAMEAEELLRSHPIDGAVLLGGCDKTTPGLVMGAISMGIPAIYVPAGPMLRGNWRGEYLGSGSDVWKYWTEKRAGRITDAQWNEMESGIARSFGTCMVMGTAATMMAIAEALGLTLPGASSIPAADSSHPRMCAAAGLETASATLPSRLWGHVLRPYRAGRRRLRFRFPRRQGPDSRAGNSLTAPSPPAEDLMKIGLFDHVEHGKRPLATLFDERLAFAKAADEAGIYCLHVAEHHATPLNMVPVPGVYLGAVARATKRMRLGPLVYLLPLYSPLRLIEEMCMLDQQSRGRLEIGFGRGSVPIEIEYYGADRVMYGSDYPCWDPATALELIQEIGLPEADLEKILCDNARQILGLKQAVEVGVGR